jgi:hypothetical protein
LALFRLQGTATIKPCFVAPTETLEKSLESSTCAVNCPLDPADPETSQPIEHETGTGTQGKWSVLCLIIHGTEVDF